MVLGPHCTFSSALHPPELFTGSLSPARRERGPGLSRGSRDVLVTCSQPSLKGLQFVLVLDSPRVALRVLHLAFNIEPVSASHTILQKTSQDQGSVPCPPVSQTYSVQVVMFMNGETLTLRTGKPGRSSREEQCAGLQRPLVYRLCPGLLHRIYGIPADLSSLCKESKISTCRPLPHSGKTWLSAAAGCSGTDCL